MTRPTVVEGLMHPDDRHSVAFVEHLPSGAGLFRCVHCTTECVLEPDGSWVPVEGSAG